MNPNNVEDGSNHVSSKSEENYHVKIDWTKKRQFVACDDKNHSLVIDTSIEGGGENSGPSPGRLLLMAVASCTAIDVVDILQNRDKN